MNFRIHNGLNYLTTFVSQMSFLLASTKEVILVFVSTFFSSFSFAASAPSFPTPSPLFQEDTDMGFTAPASRCTGRPLREATRCAPLLPTRTAAPGWKKACPLAPALSRGHLSDGWPSPPGLNTSCGSGPSASPEGVRCGRAIQSTVPRTQGSLSTLALLRCCVTFRK